MSHFCKDHPRYEAKREPKALCGDCYRLWFLKNPELKVPDPERPETRKGGA